MKERDIATLRPLVAAELAASTIQWWALWSTNQLFGFLGYTPNTIEALFIDPEYRRLGGGRALVAFAQDLAGGNELAVEVNEQNDQAVRFYRALGFSTIERSETDAAGRPFPTLRMARVSSSDAAQAELK